MSNGSRVNSLRDDGVFMEVFEPQIAFFSRNYKKLCPEFPEMANSGHGP
jgi:hypothetical protein